MARSGRRSSRTAKSACWRWPRHSDLQKYPDKPTLVESGINAVAVSPYGLVGPKDLPPPVVQALHDAVKEAMADPGHQPLLDKFIQEPWYRDPAGYRAFAEKYYVEVKPMLVKAGLAKA